MDPLDNLQAQLDAKITEVERLEADVQRLTAAQGQLVEVAEEAVTKKEAECQARIMDLQSQIVSLQSQVDQATQQAQFNKRLGDACWNALQIAMRGGQTEAAVEMMRELLRLNAEATVKQKQAELDQLRSQLSQ